jgi:hypothetical protein
LVEEEGDPDLVVPVVDPAVEFFQFFYEVVDGETRRIVVPTEEVVVGVEFKERKSRLSAWSTMAMERSAVFMVPIRRTFSGIRNFPILGNQRESKPCRRSGVCVREGTS